jgi:hypothetical protein
MGDGNPLLRPYNTSSSPWTAASIPVRGLRRPWVCCDGARLCDRALEQIWQRPKPTVARPANACGLHGHNPGTVVLLLGVMSGPAHKDRRSAIRQTWMRWASVGSAVAACFVVGNYRLPLGYEAALHAERARHNDDLLLLPVQDGRTPAITIEKAHAWWRAAARLLAVFHDDQSVATRFVGKVDDDSFVHIPRLLTTAMLGLGCDTHIYFGALAFTGYVAPTFTKCGFSWIDETHNAKATVLSSWQRRRCGERGAFPSFPFAVGQLELLSATLATRLAASKHFANFARASAGTTAQDEDVALGFVIHHMQRSGLLNVTVVDSTGPFTMHNLGCARVGSGLYSPPRADNSMVVHHVTEPAAMRYLWRVLSDERAQHDPAVCKRALSPSRQHTMG